MPFITQGKTNWKFLLIVIVLAIIVGGGVLGWQWLEFKKEMKIPEFKLPEKVKDETADWKTYRNEEYKFEIKYPEWIYLNEKCAEFSGIEPDVKKICFGTIKGYEYKFGEQTGSPIIKNEFIILITPPEYSSIDDYVKKQEQITEEAMGNKISFKIERIYIGNERGIKLTPVLENYNIPDFIVFKKGNIFIFRNLCWFACMFNACDCDEVFNQILSTFRFLE